MARAELLCEDDETALLCQPTNCAFGGGHFDQLYAASFGWDHLSCLDLKVKGPAPVESPCLASLAARTSRLKFNACDAIHWRQCSVEGCRS
jgi:hypothetical protein